MTSTATASDSCSIAHVRVWPLAAAAAGLTAVADFLFWHQWPGVSVGIFSAILATVVLLARKRENIGVGSWTAYALLLGACVQSGMQLCLTNLSVLGALLVVLAGGTYFTELLPVWRRWVRQALSVLVCGDRVFWLYGKWAEQRSGERGEGLVSNLTRAVLILAPATVMLLGFTAILSSGNLVFHDWLGHFGKSVEDWILAQNFSPWRLLCWFVIASIMLAFLRPRGVSGGPAVRELGLWTRADAKLAWLQSLTTLLALNALFAIVNTIDVAELWFHDTLPAGISRKEFLHAGVNNLIFATVLAAIVLAGIFQQSAEVTHRRAVRGLGYLWIVQNIVLAGSVYRRDYLYVLDTQLLTEKRVYVLCFLGLVVLGYLFLALHVRRGGGLGKLLWRNALATFGLFYALQFLDVGGYVSRWCAAQSITGPKWGFNVTYWATQGHAAWPAILAVAQAPGHPNGEEARNYLNGLALDEDGLSEPNWRGWQWLEEKNRAQLDHFRGARIPLP